MKDKHTETVTLDLLGNQEEVFIKKISTKTFEKYQKNGIPDSVENYREYERFFTDIENYDWYSDLLVNEELDLEVNGKSVDNFLKKVDQEIEYTVFPERNLPRKGTFIIQSRYYKLGGVSLDIEGKFDMSKLRLFFSRYRFNKEKVVIVCSASYDEKFFERRESSEWKHCETSLLCDGTEIDIPS